MHTAVKLAVKSEFIPALKYNIFFFIRVSYPLHLLCVLWFDFATCASYNEYSPPILPLKITTIKDVTKTRNGKWGMGNGE